jgi:hypothetical protein
MPKHSASKPLSQPKQVLMGQHDFRLDRIPDRGMYCVVCGSRMNSEKGQQPCAGRAA